MAYLSGVAQRPFKNTIPLLALLNAGQTSNLQVDCYSPSTSISGHRWLMSWAGPVETMQAENQQGFRQVVARRIADIVKQTKYKPKDRDFMKSMLLYERVSASKITWVRVVLRLLETSHNNSSSTLSQLLASLPPSVEAIYDRFLCSIRMDRRSIACKMLLMIAGSRRPLKPEELRLLLAIRPHHKTIEDVERACQVKSEVTWEQLLEPLVEIRSGAVELIDPTAKRYLLKLADKTDNDLCTFFGIRETEPDQVLAEACMSYLLLDDIGNAFYKIVETDCSVFSMATEIEDTSPGDSSNSCDLHRDTMSHNKSTRITIAKQALLDRYGLFDYASKYWASHLSAFGHDGAVTLFPLAETLSEAKSSVLHCWLSNYWIETHPEVEYPHYAGPVFIASFFGHPVSLQLYFKKCNIDRRVLDSALYWASSNGHYSIVMLLLQKGIEPNTAVNEKFPQHAAAECGHVNILKLFLTYRIVDMNVMYRGRTPISLAAGQGHVAAVALLISAPQVQPDLPDRSGMTALSWASINNFPFCATTLLNSLRVQVWHADTSGRTSLSLAASRGHLDLVRLFLHARGGGKDLRDLFGRTPLSYAAAAGHTSCVYLLLNYPDVDAKSLDKNGRSALSYAFEHGHVEIVRALLTRSPSCADVADNDGRAPMAWATDAQPGERAEVARLLPMTRPRNANRPRMRRAHSDSWLDKPQMPGYPQGDGPAWGCRCQHARPGY